MLKFFTLRSVVMTTAAGLGSAAILVASSAAHAGRTDLVAVNLILLGANIAIFEIWRRRLCGDAE